MKTRLKHVSFDVIAFFKHTKQLAPHVIQTLHHHVNDIHSKFDIREGESASIIQLHSDKLTDPHSFLVIVYPFCYFVKGILVQYD